ncbi:unannotated protein [freshwater metagenome]|uniref:Unannotated protein n=1 Tax=freshwater metagenome TaxID=449393 RepID=A0A6J7QBD5_9ZZZZ
MSACRVDAAPLDKVTPLPPVAAAGYVTAMRTWGTRTGWSAGHTVAWPADDVPKTRCEMWSALSRLDPSQHCGKLIWATSRDPVAQVGTDATLVPRVSRWPGAAQPQAAV